MKFGTIVKVILTIFVIAIIIVIIIAIQWSAAQGTPVSSNGMNGGIMSGANNVGNVSMGSSVMDASIQKGNLNSGNDGDVCFFDYQCGPNSYCNRDFTNSSSGGTCAPRKPVGAQCLVRDYECASGSCGSMSTNPINKQCCPGGSTTSGNPAAQYGSFCNNVLSNGQQCWLDNQCYSGNCRGNNYGINIGVCS